jgi:hypothetical protein
MDYNQLTDEELASLPPELLQEVLNEIEKGQSNDEPAPQVGGYRDIEVSGNMHPKLSNYDRWVVKNLASNPDSAIGYLKKEYPDMEFMKQKDGEIVAKGAADPYWFRLDEKATTLADVGDVVADVGQGVVEGVGGTLAGIQTLNPFVGGLAAGAIGAGAETAKQAAGKALGIPNNMNAKNIGYSAAASATMPAIGKAANSVWNYAKNKAPAIGLWLSGIPEEVLSNVNVDAQVRKEIADNGVTGYVNNLRSEVADGMETALSNAGKSVGGVTKGQNVDISGLKQQIAQTFDGLTDEQKAGWGYLKDKLVSEPDIVTPQKATELKNHFYLLARNDKSPLGKGALDAATNDLSRGEMKIATQASTGIRDALRTSAPDKDAFDVAYKNYSSVANTLTDDKLKPFNKADTTLRFLDSFGKKKTPLAEAYRDEFFGNVKNMSGVDVPKAARQYQSAQYFNNPSKLPTDLSSAGKGSAVGASLGGLAGYLMPGLGPMGAMGGTAAGAGLGGLMSSPWAMKTVGGMAPVIDEAGEKAAKYIYANPYIRSDKALYNMLNENK